VTTNMLTMAMERNLESVERDHAKVALIMGHIVNYMHALACMRCTSHTQSLTTVMTSLTLDQPFESG